MKITIKLNKRYRSGWIFVLSYVILCTFNIYIINILLGTNKTVIQIILKYD